MKGKIVFVLKRLNAILLTDPNSIMNAFCQNKGHHAFLFNTLSCLYMWAVSFVLGDNIREMILRPEGVRHDQNRKRLHMNASRRPNLFRHSKEGTYSVFSSFSALYNLQNIVFLWCTVNREIYLTQIIFLVIKQSFYLHQLIRKSNLISHTFAFSCISSVLFAFVLFDSELKLSASK